jgi:hypothetical protein
LRASSLVICPGIDPKLAALCEGTRVRVLSDAVDLAAAGADCDIAIGHATHGFTAAMLLANKPQLLLPLVLEQRLTAERVQKLGLGLIADNRDGKDVILKLRTLWERPTPARWPQRQPAPPLADVVARLLGQ